MSGLAERFELRQMRDSVRTPLACCTEGWIKFAKARRRRAYRCLLAELLILQKHFRVLRLKENQSHFLQLPIGGQKVFNRS